MALRRSHAILAAVPYATLFQHNDILQDVFRSSSHHIAVTVERPGKPTTQYTYGELQLDIVRFAGRLQSVLKLGDRVDGTGSNYSSAAAVLSPHLQLPIDETRMKGLFHAPSISWRDSHPSHLFSHEFHSSRDSGEYNVALLCHPGYEFVVALLACWTLNLMVVPLCPQHKFHGEISYYLEHSGAQVLVGDHSLMEQLLPKSFLTLSEGIDCRQTSWPLHGDSVNATSSGTCRVQHVIDITKWKADRVGEQSRQGNKGNPGAYHGSASKSDGVPEQHHRNRSDGQPLEILCEGNDNEGRVTWMPPSPSRSGNDSGSGSRLRTSEDVLELAKEAERVLEKQRIERELDEIAKNFSTSQRSSSYGTRDLLPPSYLTFDDERAHSDLNPLFYARWKQRQQAESPSSAHWAVPSAANDCLMIYTSGTTAKPKGVVHTHRSVSRQCANLQQAWEWRDTDSVLNVLPLHHVHGLVNVLLCALKSGARCVFTPFDQPKRIADRLTMGDISLFMAVPTIYAKLATAVQKDMSPIEQTGWRKSVSQQLRLMVSGSAALPVPLLDRVRNLSGHTLLERYGMTEVGMALSQPYRPVEGRVPGTVGNPLPGVEALVLTSPTEAEAAVPSTSSPLADRCSNAVVGRLALRSEALFDRYWNNPAATVADAVAWNGRTWFDTGDTVSSTRVPHSAEAVFTILGRSSVDILKCRGFKISALEVEAHLLQLADMVDEVAVFGAPDEILGEEIVAVCALSRTFRSAVRRDVVRGEKTSGDEREDDCESARADESEPEVVVVPDVHRRESSHSHSVADPDKDTSVPQWSRVAARALSTALASTVAPYKIPTKYVFVTAIPRNAMGKVNKKELRSRLLGSSQ